MQKSHYSKKEKTGRILISTIPTWFIITLLWESIWESIWKFLSIIGFSETLSNNISGTIISIWAMMALLWIICVPIWIIKVIKALKSQNKLNESFERNELNKDENFKIMLIKLSTNWILIIYIPIIVFLLSTYAIKERIIPIVLTTLLFMLIFSLWIRYSKSFRKQKEKEWKLYTPTLELAYEWEINDWNANWKWIAYYYDWTKRCEWTFKNGKLNGKWTTYYTNGKIRYKWNLKDWLANWKGTIYYKNWNIASQWTFKNWNLNSIIENEFYTMTIETEFRNELLKMEN